MKNNTIYGNEATWETDFLGSTVNSNSNLDLLMDSLESMDLFDEGEVVTGTIVKITGTDLVLDVNSKEYAYLSIQKEKIGDEYSIGDKIEVLITGTKDYLKASIQEKVRKDLLDDMKDQNSKRVYDAKVIGLSNNGYDLMINGVKVFMPGSLGGINKLQDFSSLIGKEIKVMPIKNTNSYSKYKTAVIVSHRDYLHTLIPNEIEQLQIGNLYDGVVTDCSKFGIFVEFNNVLTGLIHKDEFDETVAKLFEAKQIKPGTTIQFYLKEIVSNNRIILSRNEVEVTQKTESKFRKGQEVYGVISKVTSYGCFVKLDKKESGLIHISKLKDVSLNKGDEVNCVVIGVNGDKIDLKLK